jgi:membrane protease YdiL (CAAX protease family)
MQRKPLGLWATVVWSAVGIVMIHALWLTQWVVDALWGTAINPSPVFMPLLYIPVVAAVVAAVWMSTQSFREYLALAPLRWGDFGRGVGYGLLGFVGLIIVFALIAMLQFALGYTESSGGLGIGKSPLDAQTIVFLCSAWVTYVIAAPIGEELLFRGLLYRGLESRLGALGAIVLSSLAFGLIHYPGFGWSRVVATGCLGLLFGWLRWRTGNTGVTVVAHAATNFVAVLGLTAMVLLAS